MGMQLIETLLKKNKDLKSFSLKANTIFQFDFFGETCWSNVDTKFCKLLIFETKTKTLLLGLKFQISFNVK